MSDEKNGGEPPAAGSESPAAPQAVDPQPADPQPAEAQPAELRPAELQPVESPVTALEEEAAVAPPTPASECLPPVPDEPDTTDWAGNGPRRLISGRARFARYRAGSSVKDLPPMSCAPGRCQSWLLRKVGYLKSKKKEPSLPSLYDFLGAELVSSPDPLSRVYDKSRLPPPPAFDRNGLPHTIIFNLQLPLCEKPSLFGQQLSGKTVNAILLFTLKPETAAAAAEGCTDPAIKLLKRFLVNLSPAEKKVTDDPFLGRCKLLVRSDTGVPSAFSKYNGKPVLVTGSGRFSKTLDGSVLEVGVNIRAWTYAARLALYSNWKKVGDYRLHVGVTIEGRCDEELPERLLGCALLSLPNMVDCAPELSELPSPVPSSPGSAHTIEDDEEEPHAPAPGATAPEPAAAAPEPTAAAPEPAATAPEPAATAPEPAATAPEPAATAPEPAATAPEPTATG